VVTLPHLKWASVVGIFCMHVSRDMALRPSIYLGPLGWRPHSKSLTVLKTTCSGWLLDVGGHISKLEVG